MLYLLVSAIVSAPYVRWRQNLKKSLPPAA
jgi:hypothetical protein